MMNLSIEDSGNLIAENIDESNKERIQFIKNSLESFRHELKECHKVSETLKESVEHVIGDIECLTNEATKVKERVEKLEGSVEQYSYSKIFASELSSMQDVFDKHVNGFVEIEKNCRTQIESIKKENSKFLTTIMDEILQTSEKIEALKITIYNNRLEEFHVHNRSRNTPDVNLEDVKSCLLSQEEKQNGTEVKMDELSSVIAHMQEEMRLLVKQVDWIKRGGECFSARDQ
jgi:chromosome segregation ATPase